jgi:hypothetical protein
MVCGTRLLKLSLQTIRRYGAKDARSFVLQETFIPWLDNTVGKSNYTYLAHESMITLYNGSEIWIGGLGDKEQVDKILSHEYNTIYFNEKSQLFYVAEERKDCCSFLNETVLNHIANIEDTTGRPIWRGPTEAMLGRLDLYPYHEVSILPQIADIDPDTPFAIFMNPKRIQQGNRRGIEIKKFDATTESMEYG